MQLLKKYHNHLKLNIAMIDLAISQINDWFQITNLHLGELGVGRYVWEFGNWYYLQANKSKFLVLDFCMLAIPWQL